MNSVQLIVQRVDTKPGEFNQGALGLGPRVDEVVEVRVNGRTGDQRETGVDSLYDPPGKRNEFMVLNSSMYVS